jgi:hypothetical protein
MPVEKYRSIADVPPPPPVPQEDRAARIRAIWKRAALLSGGEIPRGLTRFHDIDEANRARTRATIERMRRRSARSP